MPIGQPIKQEGAIKPSSLEQQVYDEDIFAQRITEIPSNQQARWEYNTDGTLLYAGFAPRGLSENTNQWLLQTFAYDANKRPVSRKIAYDSWTNRGSADYA